MLAVAFLFLLAIAAGVLSGVVGTGSSLLLLPALRQSCPQAQTLVMTGQPTVNGTIAALRAT